MATFLEVLLFGRLIHKLSGLFCLNVNVILYLVQGKQQYPKISTYNLLSCIVTYVAQTTNLVAYYGFQNTEVRIISTIFDLSIK